MKKPKRVSKKAMALLRLKSHKRTRSKTKNVVTFSEWLRSKGLVEQVTSNVRGLKVPRKKKLSKKKQTRCVVIKPKIETLLSKPGPLPPLCIEARKFPVKTTRGLIRENLNPVIDAPIGYRYFSDWAK